MSDPNIIKRGVPRPARTMVPGSGESRWVVVIEPPNPPASVWVSLLCRGCGSGEAGYGTLPVQIGACPTCGGTELDLTVKQKN